MKKIILHRFITCEPIFFSKKRNLNNYIFQYLQKLPLTSSTLNDAETLQSPFYIYIYIYFIYACVYILHIYMYECVHK